MSIGSGLFKKMHGKLAHLLQTGGLAGEIADVRKDIAATVAPLHAITVEEYDYPPAANATALMGATASSTSPQTYLMNGAVGVSYSPPTNVEVVVSGAGTPGHMPATVTVVGLDAWGRPLTEVIATVGAGTKAGAACFALVEKLVLPAGTGALASFTVGTGALIGLSQYPKTRTGQLVTAGSGALIRREVVDGSVVTSGALTAAATNLPFGAYTPGTAPTTQAPAVQVGSVDMTTAGLYGGGGTLTGTSLVLTVNGVGPTTLALTGANVATEAAFLAAVAAEWPTLVVTTAPTTNFLTLTTALSDQSAAIVVAANGTSTANPFLGLTAGTTHGAGHRYAIEYEFDASQVADVVANP